LHAKGVVLTDKQSVRLFRLHSDQKILEKNNKQEKENEFFFSLMVGWEKK